MEVMMQGGLALMRSAVTGEVFPLPEGFDMETAYPLLKKHHMDALIYEGAVRCGVDPKLPVMQQLFQKYCRHLLVSEGQQRQVKRIFAAFEDAGIDYLPLKGSRMKRLYPKHELRYMGDADILIRVQQYPKIISIMESLGYVEEVESDYDFHWKHPELNVELHKRLSPFSSGDLSDYFGTGWDLAAEREGHCWTMSAEDEWIYLFCHFTKHFRDSGIGCRHVLDLWVYLHSHRTLDETYIRGEMEKLRLLEFYVNIRRLLTVWFEDAPMDEKSCAVGEYIFSCGSWGTVENQVLSRSLRDTGARTDTGSKVAYLWHTVFPKRIMLEGQYRVLKKAPWLLPGVWIYRLFHKLVLEHGILGKMERKLASLTTEKLDNRRQFLQDLGLEL